MSKFIQLQNAIYSIFARAEWKAENIPTRPSNYIEVNPLPKYIRTNIVHSGAGVNSGSLSGLLIIDIFTPYGLGTEDAFSIADALDRYLVSKSINTADGLVQFKSSAFQGNGQDSVNSSLYRSTYTIPFNFFRSN